MGNKLTCMTVGTDLHSRQGIKGNLHIHLSEECYIPMPLTMKRTLIDGRKFRYVAPSRVSAATESVDGTKEVQVEESRKESKEEGTETRSRVESDVNIFHVEPIVTVLNMSTTESTPTSLLPFPVEKEPPQKDRPGVDEISAPCRKSGSLEKKTRSTVDMKKSKFTMELEERLRRSKLELGLDADLNDLKEFSYRLNERKRSDSMHRKYMKLNRDSNVGRGLEKVCLKEPLQYVAHNCQILGLCSVRTPDLLASSEKSKPNIFNDEITRKPGENNPWKDEHPRRKDCTCDVCTLVYLTDIGFGEECASKRTVVSIQKSRKQSGHSVATWIGSGDAPMEVLRIIDPENSSRSVEISVSDGKSTQENLSLTSDESSGLNSSTNSTEDNYAHINDRRTFESNAYRYNNHNEIYNNSNVNYNDVSIVNASSADQKRMPKIYGKSNGSKPRLNRMRPTGLSRSSVFNRPLSKSRMNNKSSSSMLGASVASSLSTVLSYQRVRQIFQSIIERNRSRKKTRRNIHKFREMEDLGLGKVRNNRWYPSDSKTFSIWSNMHSSVQGVQAQFMKYPKTSSKM